ncbi:hypothetical protein [Microbacterium thalassium]|uniref:Uncharacterized protein n=1 Tax=Microbacterium thalassium TaxID=362649 RepID=A0A7X0FQX3_9MICO|nr:hypothetical protein [Microbacterium thalassium]MBB6392064.1 hypothetical protein [Microbacterium thalassium]GLK24977.1 hypothetical protein GCM10017607_22950 [Microbacterium thalassium]
MSTGARASDAATAAIRTAARRRVLRTWIPAATIAEAVGFVVPAAAGVATASAAPSVQLATLLGAGAIEGALLGAGQAWALRRLDVPVRASRWVLLTAAGAILAYVCGMAPSTWASSLVTAPPAVLIPVGMVLGAVLVASIGGAQWVELRRHVPRAGHWVWITAVAWLAALGAFLGIAMPLWTDGQPFWLMLAIGIGAGLVMAAVAATVTGFGLARLLRPRRGSDRSAPRSAHRSSVGAPRHV